MRPAARRDGERPTRQREWRRGPKVGRTDNPAAEPIRELEVLALIVAGRSNAEIADELFISRKTASVHVANIKGKFGAASRVEIATMALERGLVTRPSSGRSALTSK